MFDVSWLVTVNVITAASLRQGGVSSAGGGDGGSVLHPELHAGQEQRRAGEAGALAGHEEPDASLLCAGAARQREWAAACGAARRSQRHQQCVHQTRQLQRRGLLRLHLRHLSYRIQRGTDMSHCHR